MHALVPPPPRHEVRFLLGAAGALASFLVVLIASAVAYASASAWVDHTLEVQKTADEWLTAVLETEDSARRYVLAPTQSSRLDAYEAAAGGAQIVGERLLHSVEGNAPQEEHVATAQRDERLAFQHLADLVALVHAGHASEATARMASGDGSNVAHFREEVRQIRIEEERLLVARRANVTKCAVLTIGGALLFSLAAGALLAFAWIMQRDHQRLTRALATEARGRLKALSDVASALSLARTRGDVASTVVKQAMRAERGDTCALYMLNDAGTTLELIGDQGIPPDIRERILRISAYSEVPVMFESLREGTTLWAESEEEYRRLFPEIAGMESEDRGVKAFWMVPLVIEGQTVGLLGMGFHEPRQFSVDERAFVDTLTKQCAEALLRATRLERADAGRRWFTATLRSIGDAVIVTDPRGRITFMNPVAETLTGWRERDATDRPLEEVFDILSEHTRAKVESPVTKVLREGAVVGLANHTLLRSKNGREIPIDDSGAPIRSEGGMLIGVVLVFRDATRATIERGRRDFLARAGEALVSSVDYQATLATVARLAVPGIADWCAIVIKEPASGASHQAAVAHVDPDKLQFARRLGQRYPPDPDAKTGTPEVIRTGRSELYKEVPDALLVGAARDAEHLALLRELKLESAMIVPLAAHGRTFGALTFVYAESGRRYAEDDLAFAEDFARRAAMSIENSLALEEARDARAKEHILRDDAEIANRAKDEFLAMVSHELRTPLTAILGWAVTLRARNAGPELDRGLAVIERNARAQAKLIEDVLDVSRVISGKLSLNLRPTSVTDVVCAAIETVKPAAEAKNITISPELPRIPLTITADADRVQQIVWNLLSNAVKFSPKGSKVSVRVSAIGSELQIAVQDAGEGIPSAALPFVFERFQQADASTTRRHGGLGLGLAIVKQLVTAHGGTVRAESEGVGKGATFTVCLPARTAVPPLRRAPRAPGDAPYFGPVSPRLDGLRLLVIDDEDDALSLLSHFLREYGAEVHIAASATQALAEFSHVRPDVIVSDIGMPEMDGYSLIRKIRSLPMEQGGRTPAVALTAYARSEDAQRAFAAGYQVHVSKPVEPSHLVTVVATLGGRSLDAGAPS